MTDNKDGIQYLAYVLDKLRQRIAEISQSIAEGQKEIDGMHEYYWENTQKWTSMDMKILTISRRCFIKSVPMSSNSI